MRDPSDVEPSGTTLGWQRVPLRWRLAASVLLAVHMLAVFTAPWMSSTQSPLAASFFSVMEPYLDGLELNNGYQFFAPEPGPSHLVRYDLYWSDGRHESGVFPNRQEHWPRLLYHRYFMLTDMALMTGPPDPSWRPGTDWAQLKTSAHEQTLARAYAARLLRDSGADRVALYFVLHYLPRPDEVRAGMSLTDPSLYVQRQLGVFSRCALLEPAPESAE